MNELWDVKFWKVDVKKIVDLEEIYFTVGDVKNGVCGVRESRKILLLWRDSFTTATLIKDNI